MPEVLSLPDPGRLQFDQYSDLIRDADEPLKQIQIQGIPIVGALIYLHDRLRDRIPLGRNLRNDG